MGAAALHHEQADQDRHHQRHHQRREARRLHRHAFYRRQHGDGGCQHAVAEEQRQPDNGADADGGLHLARQAMAAMRQRRQRQGAAFAVIVGAHDDGDIFDRHHQDQGPEDHRERTHHRDMIGQPAFGGEHGGLQGVKRAGANVAEDHAHRAQHQAKRVMVTCVDGLGAVFGCEGRARGDAGQGIGGIVRDTGRDLAFRFHRVGGDNILGLIRGHRRSRLFMEKEMLDRFARAGTIGPARAASKRGEAV